MLRFLSALFTLPLIAMLAILWFVLAERPIVTPNETTSGRRPISDPATRLQSLIESNLSRLPFPSVTRVRMRSPNTMEVEVAIKTPLPRPFLNVIGQFTIQDQQTRLSHLRFGHVSLSGILLTWLSDLFLAEFTTLPPGVKERQIVSVLHGKDLSTLPWKAFLANRDSLDVYYRVLSRWSRAAPQRHSLLEPFRLLFRRARQRSGNRTAAEENRALLQVLAAYTLGLDPAALFQLPRQPLRNIRLTLKGRHDLARHFLVSAAVASSSHAALSSALGLYKEFSDFDTGSGFSFSDLAADRAGTQFGMLAVSRPRYLQTMMIWARSEDWFMPAIDDLPDHLSRGAFRRRFDGANSSAYDGMVKLIDRRIATCILYRGH